MFDFEIGYIGLLLTSFFAATIIPVSSEAFLIIMLTMGYEPFSCLIVATTGNTLGGWSNYIIGRVGNPSWLNAIGASQKKSSVLEE